MSLFSLPKILCPKGHEVSISEIVFAFEQHILGVYFTCKMCKKKYTFHARALKKKGK